MISEHQRKSAVKRRNLVQKDQAIPWHKIAGMRNVLAHEYLGVDHRLLWETVVTQLGPLQCALENIVNKD